MFSQSIRSALTSAGALMSRPAAYLIVVAYTAVWLIFSHETLEWHGVATLATWVMTLFIQRAEHRDTQAIHAKLDKLLHHQGETSGEFTKLDEKEPEEIEAKRGAELN